MEDKTKPMCRSGCGFYGNPATDGFCSFCYNALISKDQSRLTHSTSITSSAFSTCGTYETKMLFVEKKSSECTSMSNSLLKTNIGEPHITFKLHEDSKSIGSSIVSEDNMGVSKCGKIPGRNSLRCAAKNCRRKLGLTDVQCRCGERFCPIHRYSDRHECSFNYRELGAQEIRRKNPKVVGEKIQKI